MKSIPHGLLEEITRRLVDELHPQQVYLFGSHAWGEPGDDSDIDLLVVMEAADEDRWELAVRARRLLRDIGAPKDVLIRTPERMTRSALVATSLERKVRERGRLLYDAAFA